jgi:hypothetical protein
MFIRPRGPALYAHDYTDARLWQPTWGPVLAETPRRPRSRSCTTRASATSTATTRRPRRAPPITTCSSAPSATRPSRSRDLTPTLATPTPTTSCSSTSTPTARRHRSSITRDDRSARRRPHRPRRPARDPARQLPPRPRRRPGRRPRRRRPRRPRDRPPRRPTPRHEPASTGDTLTPTLAQSLGDPVYDAPMTPVGLDRPRRRSPPRPVADRHGHRGPLGRPPRPRRAALPRPAAWGGPEDAALRTQLHDYTGDGATSTS